MKIINFKINLQFPELIKCFPLLDPLFSISCRIEVGQKTYTRDIYVTIDLKSK